MGHPVVACRLTQCSALCIAPVASLVNRVSVSIATSKSSAVKVGMCFLMLEMFRKVIFMYLSQSDRCLARCGDCLMGVIAGGVVGIGILCGQVTAM